MNEQIPRVFQFLIELLLTENEYLLMPLLDIVKEILIKG